MSEIKELLKKDAIFFDNEGGGKCVNIPRGNYDQILTLLDQQPSSEFIKECRELIRKGVADEQWEYATKLREACDIIELKDQPTSEFTKKLRNFVKMYENEMPKRAEITFLEQACGIIDRVKSINKDLLEELKLIIALLCHPGSYVTANDIERAKDLIAKAKKEGEQNEQSRNNISERSVCNNQTNGRG